LIDNLPDMPYRWSHGLRIANSLIAACLSLAIAILTKNERDYRFIAGLRLLPYPQTFSS
jgi:predicted nucleic acid-binding protein